MIAYLILTFELVTLTQLKPLIDIDNVFKFRQDPTICTLFLGPKQLMLAYTQTNIHLDTKTDISAYQVASNLS